MARPYHSAHAAAKAHAGAHGVRVTSWLDYADRLIRRGIIVPAPPSQRAVRDGPNAVRAEQWRGHRWIITEVETAEPECNCDAEERPWRFCELHDGL